MAKRGSDIWAKRGPFSEIRSGGSKTLKSHPSWMVRVASSSESLGICEPMWSGCSGGSARRSASSKLPSSCECEDKHEKAEMWGNGVCDLWEKWVKWVSGWRDIRYLEVLEARLEASGEERAIEEGEGELECRGVDSADADAVGGEHQEERAELGRLRREVHLENQCRRCGGRMGCDTWRQWVRVREKNNLEEGLAELFEEGPSTEASRSRRAYDGR